MKTSYLVAIFTLIFLQTTVVAEDSKKGVIENVRVLADGEPDGYRGKALEITLTEVLEENSDVSFVVTIKTNSDFSFVMESFLTTRSTYDQPKKLWLKNLYLALARHETEERRRRLKEEVVPGNIKSLHIKITEENKGFFSSKDVVIGEHTFDDL